MISHGPAETVQGFLAPGMACGGEPVRIGALAVTVLALLLAAPTAWITYGPAGVQLVTVSVDDSERVLAVAVQVPAGRDGCSRDLAGGLTEFDPAVAYVRIVFQSRLASVVGACPSNRVMTVRVSLPAPLGRRDVMINSDTTTTFGPGHRGLLHRCYDGCGPFILPPASCTTRSYQQAMLSTGPPMHAVYQVLGCDGRWLVLDVAWPGGPAGCDAPCNPSLAVTRWFFRAGPHGWMTITTTLTAGCVQVRKAEPRFPAQLCASLSAPR